MFIVISGGGKIGSFLAQDLAGKGHGVVLVERRPEIVERLARELPAGVLVIAGDGCDARHLEQAGIERADVFAAVTGEDAGNLVACQLARVSYHVRRAVARVNSPRNERIFRALGIEAISSTTVIGRLIEEEFALGEILQLLSLAKGRLSLVELDLPGAGCPACGTAARATQAAPGDRARDRDARGTRLRAAREHALRARGSGHRHHRRGPARSPAPGLPRGMTWVARRRSRDGGPWPGLSRASPRSCSTSAHSRCSP